MTRSVVVWGASGHAKVLREAFGAMGVEVVAVVDNNPEAVSPFMHLKALHGWNNLEAWRRTSRVPVEWSVVAIGGTRGAERVSIGEKLSVSGLRGMTVVHPAAYASTDAVLGEGTQILAGAVVGAEASLGDWTIVNTSASIDHECTIGRGCHIAPGARLAGCVTVEDYAMVGVGAVILPRLKIGRGAVVGAGAVVVRDVAPETVVVGNPARHLRDVPLGLS